MACWHIYIQLCCGFTYAAGDLLVACSTDCAIQVLCQWSRHSMCRWGTAERHIKTNKCTFHHVQLYMTWVSVLISVCVCGCVCVCVCVIWWCVCVTSHDLFWFILLMYAHMHAHTLFVWSAGVCLVHHSAYGVHCWLMVLLECVYLFMCASADSFVWWSTWHPCV